MFLHVCLFVCFLTLVVSTWWTFPAKSWCSLGWKLTHTHQGNILVRQGTWKARRREKRIFLWLIKTKSRRIRPCPLITHCCAVGTMSLLKPAKQWRLFFSSRSATSIFLWSPPWSFIAARQNCVFSTAEFLIMQHYGFLNCTNTIRENAKA